MSIWKMCQDYLRERRQKGQIIVFTAVLLPFIIAMCGLTVDFGNMYVHKSKLQNAADAAAIAGAYAYAENGENKTSYPNAKAASQKSLDANLPDTTLASGKCKPFENTDGSIYYGVKISENVPIYFLRLFNVGDTAEVAADAFASINSTGGGGIFKNLFSFGSNGFTSINDSQNPDNASIADIGQSCIYEGDIKGIGSDANMTKNYRHELLTKKTLDEYKKGNLKVVQDAIDKQDGTITNKNYPYDKLSTTEPKVDGYYTTPEKDTSTTLDSELANILAAAKAEKNSEYKWDNGIDIATLAARGTKYIYNPNGINPEIRVNTTLSPIDADNTPLYIICDTWAKLDFRNNTTVDKNSRPIVFVYTGTGTLNLEGQGGFFHGIIYAPYANIHLNDSNTNFYGSIAAKGLEITGHPAYYEIDKNLSDKFGGSGSGSGSTSVGLVSPPSDINWD